MRDSDDTAERISTIEALGEIGAKGALLELRALSALIIAAGRRNRRLRVKPVRAKH